MIHRADLAEQDIGQYEGIPVTSVERSILDVLLTTKRTDIARQAVSDALREGLLDSTQVANLRKIINRTSHHLSTSTND